MLALWPCAVPVSMTFLKKKKKARPQHKMQNLGKAASPRGEGLVEEPMTGQHAHMQASRTAPGCGLWRLVHEDCEALWRCM